MTFPALTPASFQNGIKALVGCSLALVISQLSHLYNSFWILVTVIILINASPQVSWHKSIARICGTVLGALSAVVVFSLFIQDPFWLAVSLMVCMIISGYGSCGQEYPYAFLIYGITCVIIISQGLTSVHNIFPTAFYRTIDITIGILIYWAVNMTLWPRPYRKDIPLCLGQGIKDLRTICSSITDKINGADPLDTKDFSQLGRDTGRLLDDNLALLGELQKNPFLHDDVVDKYTQVGTALKDALFKLDFLIDLIESDVNVRAIAEIKEGLEERTAAVTHRLDDLLLLLPPRSATALPVIPVDHEAYRRLYSRLRERRLLNISLVSDDLVVIETLRVFESVEESLHQAGESLRRFSQVDHRTILHPRPLTLMAGYIRDHLLQPDLYGLRHGIKLGLTVLITIIIIYTTRWQGGFAMLVTVLISMQPNLGSGLKMMTQRIAGSLVGIGIGLFLAVAIFPAIGSLASLLLFTAPVFFLIGWGVTTRPGQTTIFLQTGIALCITTLSEYANPTNLESFAARGLGVIAGCLIAGTVNYLVWPVQARGMLLRKLSKLVGDSRQISSLLFSQAPLPDADENRIRKIRTLAQATAADARKLLADARTEMTASTLNEACASQLIELLRALPIHITVAGNLWRKCADLPLSHDLLAGEFSNVFSSLDRRLEDLEKALDTGKLPAPDQSIEKALGAITQKIYMLLKERGALIDDPSDFAKFVLLRQTLRSINELLNKISLSGPLSCAPARVHHILRKALTG